MIVFGLTGNTGTGKTTVADALRRRGIPVVDADQIAREIVHSGETALEEIVSAFGDEYLDDDGELRRQKLGRLIFGDKEARAKLEAITHPRIALRARDQLDEYTASGETMAVYDSAILVETGLAKAFSALVVVYAEPDEQLDRIMTRDGLSRRDAQQRVNAQLSLSEKMRLADYVVENTGSLADLESRVARLVKWMREQVIGKDQDYV